MKKIFLLFVIILVGANCEAQNPNFNWGNMVGDDSSVDIAKTNVCDSYGNTFVIGRVGLPATDYDPGPGTYTMSTSNGTNFIIKFAEDGSFLWAKNYGGNCNNVSINIDQSNNIYLLGTYQGTIDVDPSSGIYNLSAPSFTNSLFVSKLDQNGNFIWAKSIVNSTPTSLAVDKSQNILITAVFNGTIDVDPNATVNMISSSGSNNVFLLKLGNTGNTLFTKLFDGSVYQSINQMVTDNHNNILITGYFNATTDFDTGLGIYNQSISGNSAIYIQKLDSIGNFIWVNTYGGALGYNFGYSLAIDNSDNIYATGFYTDPIDFDNSAGTYTVSSNGSSDIYILKLDKFGDLLWVKSVGGVSADEGYGIALDTLGNVNVVGMFESSVDFDPGSGTHTLSTSNFSDIDGFILRLDSTGNFIWVGAVSGLGFDKCFSVTIDAHNSLHINGSFGGGSWYSGNSFNNVDLDPTSGVSWTPLTGSMAPFVIKIGPCPSPLYAISGYTSVCAGITTSYSVSPSVGATGYVWSTPLNSIINTGMNTNSISLTYSLSPGNIVVTPTNSCGSGLSATVAVLFNAPLVITSSTAAICRGSSVSFSVSGATSYTWSSGVNTQTINLIPVSSTTYSVTGINSLGCIGNQTVSINVDTTCADVWPGDANSDGIANNLDVLELGLHYGQTGPVRMYQWIAWYALTSVNWMGSITNGKNLSHSDCNGDGTINSMDTLAIYNNYGSSHVFKTAQTATVNAQVSIVPDQASVVKGTWGTASIYLGDITNSINNINGLAFTIDFDKTLIETNNIYVEYQNSFLDPSYQNLRFRKLNLALGKIYTATTHTVNNNASGYGKIATLHYKIKSTITTDQVLNLGISQANQSDASGAVVSLTSGTGTLMAMGTSVGLQELNGNNISINPNPTSGSLTINSKTELQKIEVVSITGQLLLSETSTNVSHTLHLDNFSNGIYFVNIYQYDRIVKREKIVLNK